MIRVGLVGCGRMGEVHLNLVGCVRGVQIVGVADTDLSRANALAAKGRIGLVAGDLDGLLGLARPDAVHILALPATHASLACAVLKVGCHVFVEKPMVLTAREAGMIVAATDRSRLLTVGHNHLFDPVVKETCARVTEGRLGQLIGLDAFHGALPDRSAWLSELPTGPWMDAAPHLLYLSQLFLGDLLTVRANGYPNGKGSKGTEVRIVAQHGGGSSSLTFSEATVPYRHRLTLYGTKWTLEVDLVARTLVEVRPFGGHRWLTKGMATLDVTSQLLLGVGRNAVRVLMGRERGWPGLRELLCAFYSAIRTGGPSPVPAAQGVRVAELTDEIGRCLKGLPSIA